MADISNKEEFFFEFKHKSEFDNVFSLPEIIEVNII